jgi:hypothetical protein
MFNKLSIRIHSHENTSTQKTNKNLSLKKNIIENNSMQACFANIPIILLNPIQSLFHFQLNFQHPKIHFPFSDFLLIFIFLSALAGHRLQAEPTDDLGQSVAGRPDHILLIGRQLVFSQMVPLVQE